MLYNTADLVTATYVYDMSRLISRRNAESPTGIDRVDIQYARHLCKCSQYNSVFVCQWDGTLHLIPKPLASKIIMYLSKKWFGVPTTAISFDMELKAIGVLRSATKNDPKSNHDSIFKFIPLDTYSKLLSIPDDVRQEKILKVDLNRFVSKPIPLFSRLPNYAKRKVLKYVSSHPRFLQPFVMDQEEDVSLCQKPKIADELCRKLKASEKVTYLNFSHHGLLDTGLFTELKTQFGASFVFYIHDIIPIDFPEYVRPGAKDDHRRRIANVCNLDSTILVNSAYTKSRLVEYCKNENLHLNDPIVSYIGLDKPNVDLHQTEVGPKKPYFITIGTIEGRKNHIALLHIWREMIEQDLDCPNLYIVGKRGWANGSVLDLLDNCEALRTNVVELNDVSDIRLFKLLANAQALLFPSFSEGWGMPIVEALSCGTPVICSDIPVFKEATEGLGEFISPIDLPEWKKAILDYALPNSERRTTKLKEIERFQGREWQQSLEQFDALFGVTQ